MNGILALIAIVTVVALWWAWQDITSMSPVRGYYPSEDSNPSHNNDVICIVVP